MDGLIFQSQPEPFNRKKADRDLRKYLWKFHWRRRFWELAFTSSLSLLIAFSSVLLLANIRDGEFISYIIVFIGLVCVLAYQQKIWRVGDTIATTLS